MANTAKFWDKVARKYSRDTIKDVASYEYTLERTRSYLKPSDHVIEFGAGTSSTAMLLAGDVARFTATDISSEMVQIGREKLEQSEIGNLDIVVGVVADHAAQDKTYDVVLGHNLFHLVEQPEQVFDQIAGLVPKGGVFISKTPCLADEPNSLKRMMFRTAVFVLTAVGYAPRPVHFYKILTLERMIEAAGFEIIESGNYPKSPPSRYVVARRV